MNRKLLLYSLVGVLVGSAATALAFSLTPKASQQAIAPVSSPSKTIVAQNQATPTPTTSPRNTTVPRGSWMQSQEHFVTMMIPHHEGAVAMADLALSRAKHPELKKLAEVVSTIMSYYFSKILNVSFDEAIAKVLEGLKQEGFGVLTEIDVQATMKKKFDCLAKEEKWKSNADRFCGLSVLS